MYGTDISTAYFKIQLLKAILLGESKNLKFTILNHKLLFSPALS